ncbi:carboxypeptidase inhibitor SmCI-like isoform X2 [Mytilus edulis]|uniref:carboxypeptidase inhibitor SmCI-like isoform X2 n=1 Tax=Mytilus edulis TaxID=6550 RepID=UPI0039EF628E
MYIGSLMIVLLLALTAEAQQSDNLCDLPKVAGPCNARIKRFYFDVNSGICGEFYYGGCDDNENNFKTIEECKTVCNKRICTLPHVKGPGGVAIQRWFYNSDTMKCETFSYGGSNGNKNNFKTKTECEGLCNGVKKDPCGPLPSCPRPPFGSCFGFTYYIINGVKCISGCSFGCPQKPCPKDPLESCISCIPEIGDKCSGDKICCSGCCRDPVIGTPASSSNRHFPPWKSTLVPKLALNTNQLINHINVYTYSTQKITWQHLIACQLPSRKPLELRKNISAL